MIQHLSHVNVFVKNQEEALAFYTEKMGFEVRADLTLEGFRWLTVGPPEQKDLEIVLMEVKEGGMFTGESARTMHAMMDQGIFGAGVFRTQDCQATYETLCARGVEFTQPPQERPYGIEAILRDNSGNWYSLVQET